jgi:hypothetical protein
MRAAPAVSVRCQGGGVWRALRAGLPAVAIGTLALWLGQHFERSDSAWGAAWSVHPSWAREPIWIAAALALVVAILCWGLARPVAREVRWDGQRWMVDRRAGRLALMIDLGPWLLLRWRPEAGAGLKRRWLAVSSREAGTAWHPLRAALYSRAPPTAPMPVSPSHNQRSADGRP